MGAQLEGLVWANHAHLPDRPKLVLLRMAHIALDQPSEKHPNIEPGLYFGGWERLALALGFEVPDAADDDEVRRLRRNAKEPVRRAIAYLVKVGAVERLVDTDKVHSGTRQHYRLHLFAPHRGAS